MFVNDTSRLPDSGRVCVMGSQGRAQGARTFYSLVIDSARAEVALMPEPRNPAYVLGVGAYIDAIKGLVFAAYFAPSRDRFDAQPNYQSELFVLVDDAVYAVKAEHIDTRLRRGFVTRRFTLLRGDRPQRSVEYRWPWYREPFVSAIPGGVRSRDFLHELAAMVREYS
jgi:hypothetical protein